MRKLNHKRGQTIVELAIFGSLILFLFGALLSHMQRLNDQQYVEMEAFRRALEKACTYQGVTSGGAGASVQYTLLQNRRLVDLSSGFKKGSPSTTGYSSSVFWAIPKVDEDAEAESLITYKINDDERTWDYRDFIPKTYDDSDPSLVGALRKVLEDDETFRIEDTVVNTNTNFEETTAKEENLQQIANTRQSALNETITTTVNYSIRKEDGDNNPDNDPIVEGPAPLWTVEQGLYRGKDGQYKYGEAALDTEVTSQRTWVTEFTE